MRTTGSPVEDAKSDEGSVVEEDSDNSDGFSDDEDFVKESHNDYEAVSNIQDVLNKLMVSSRKNGTEKIWYS